MLFRMLYDRKLAQASYLIGCQQTGDALVIDPQRDVDRYLEAAALENLRITAITETHIHADFLSGARELAERTGARLYLSDEGDADWKYRWLDKKLGGGSYDHQLLKSGDIFRVGRIEIKALHTPGHTPEHLVFLVTDRGGGASEPMGVASGDFVFVGDVGRPDLLETAAGIAGVKEESARQLFRSLQLFRQLPDYLQLWPGHGAGSACGKALGAVPQSTVGYEKRYNPAVTLADENRFVENILYGQPEPPLYFARMKRENKEGPAILGELPTPGAVPAAAIPDLLQRPISLIDTRPWPEFAAGHLPGALFAPLNTAFPTVVGSYVEPGSAIYLVVAESRVREAVVDLIHIGLDEVTGYITPQTLAEYKAGGGEIVTTKFLHMAELQKLPETSDAQILDVRRADEFLAGHVQGAVNIAHTRLLERLNELPKDKPLLVHCLSGSRSAYATALLQRHGFDATQLDGGIQAWIRTGGKVVRD
ncbi:MAG: MBL fold metallo-hydrolase [Calditrichaeota bacterium]|nr:MAG: MBL fold metallo-hydrolase [Calditrichota bacterium]